MKTYSAKPLEVERNWVVVDADGLTLGRLASVVAGKLRGKHKPQFTPHVDTGDFVVVVNAAKIAFSAPGKKQIQKLYRHHTGYPGGLKEETLKSLLARKPEAVIEKAVWGMLPHTSLGRQQMKKLYVYAGDQHPHQAQQPQPLEVKEAQ